MDYVKPSASALERAIYCPPSVFLPVRTSSSNAAAERGTAIHTFLDNVCMGMSREEALNLVEEEYKETCKLISSEFLEKITNPQTELSFGVDFDSGEATYLGHHLGRNYPEVPDTVFTGTLDILGVNKTTGIPLVVDIKSGQELTPAEHNWQVKFLVYAAYKHYGYKTVEGALIYVREEEDPYIDSWTFSEEQLINIGKDLRKFYHTLLRESQEYKDSGKLHLRESSKCSYCPAAISCPAKIGAMQALSVRAESTEIGNLRETILALSPEQAAVAWKKYRNLKSYWVLAEKAMKEYVHKHGIEGDDFEVRSHTSSRTSLSSDKLIKLARKAGVTDIEIASCRSKNTFAKISERKKKSK